MPALSPSGLSAAFTGCYPRPRHMNTTLRSSKDDIATAAIELIDGQAEQLQELQQRQRVLWALVALLSAALLVRV